MKVGIVHIGDELLTGKINPYPVEMIREILSKNAEISLLQIVIDDVDEIVRSISHAKESQIDILIITGGLGPTLDDLTRDAIAKCMNVELEIDQTALDDLRGFMVKKHPEKELDDTSKHMARIPRGSVALHNMCGAACGIKVKLGALTLYSFPGFPNEFMPMFKEYVLPDIIGNDEIVEELSVFIGESEIDPCLRRISEKYSVRVASLPSLEWKTKGNKVLIKGEKDRVAHAKKELENYINSL